MQNVLSYAATYAFWILSIIAIISVAGRLVS